MSTSPDLEQRRHRSTAPILDGRETAPTNERPLETPDVAFCGYPRSRQSPMHWIRPEWDGPLSVHRTARSHGGSLGIMVANADARPLQRGGTEMGTVHTLRRRAFP